MQQISKSRRGIAVGAVVASLTGLIGFGRAVGLGADRASAWESGFSPVAQVLTTGRDASWVCGAGTLAPGATSTTDVVDQPVWISLFNSSQRSIDVSLDVLYDSTPARPVAASNSALTLRAGERRDVKVVDFVAELPAPATVVSAEDPSKTLAGAIYGAVAVRAADPALVVSYATGPDASLRWSACATSANRRWIVPSGNTQKDASLQLIITNPFDDVATVDLAVRTEAGFVEPPDFSGLVVNPHSIRVINIGDHVRRRETVAVDATIRNGRAVMSWMQLPASGAATSGLASSGASATLRWTGLEFADNVSYGLWVYNPSIDQPSSVEITPLFEGGEAFPFVIDLGPTEQRYVDLSIDPRIVKNVPVTLDLRVVSGAPVAGQLSFSGADNSVRLGRDVSGGVPVDAHRWIVPVVQATDVMTTSLNVYNPNDVAIAFTVREYVGADQLDFGVPQTTNRIVAAGGTLVVPLDKMRADSSAVSVESTGAIVVVAQYDAIGTPASSQTLGVVVR